MGWLGNREWTSMMLWLNFLKMPISRIQARNPVILCMVILVQFFSGVILVIACCAYLVEPGSGIGTNSIDWAQLNRFRLNMETESSL
jgi:hypothetical protein